MCFSSPCAHTALAGQVPGAVKGIWPAQYWSSHCNRECRGGISIAVDSVGEWTQSLFPGWWGQPMRLRILREKSSTTDQLWEWRTLVTVWPEEFYRVSWIKFLSSWSGVTLIVLGIKNAAQWKTWKMSLTQILSLCKCPWTLWLHLNCLLSSRWRSSPPPL